MLFYSIIALTELSESWMHHSKKNNSCTLVNIICLVYLFRKFCGSAEQKREIKYKQKAGALINWCDNIKIFLTEILCWLTWTISFFLNRNENGHFLGLFAIVFYMSSFHWPLFLLQTPNTSKPDNSKLGCLLPISVINCNSTLESFESLSLDIFKAHKGLPLLICRHKKKHPFFSLCFYLLRRALLQV